MAKRREEIEKELPLHTTLYFVNEHLYYTTDENRKKDGPFKEYCVCKGEVTRIFFIKFWEIRVLGKSPEGFLTPYYFKYSNVGKTVFFTFEEAAAYAEELTTKYERIWWRICPEEMPLRRPWLDKKGD